MISPRSPSLADIACALGLGGPHPSWCTCASCLASTPVAWLPWERGFVPEVPEAEGPGLARCEPADEALAAQGGA